MKTKNLVLISLLACFLSACVTGNYAWSINEDIKKVQIGMTKNEVIQVLGKNYTITSASKDDEGNYIEVLGYESVYDEEYKLKFINNKLVEWNRERIPKYITTEPES